MIKTIIYSGGKLAVGLLLLVTTSCKENKDRGNEYDGLAKTPPMGWNSWNKFKENINDQLIREIADAMVSSGMRDAGYEYINIDDFWEAENRDSLGNIQSDPERFPDMKALADYVHSKGLKLGIYSTPGNLTCGLQIGSYGHEEQDAKTFAEWGIDYLKYDWCGAGWSTSGNPRKPGNPAGLGLPDAEMPALYKLMGDALKATGRPIVYSICQYGRYNVGTWGDSVGGNLWRTSGDISDHFSSMVSQIEPNSRWAEYAGPGRWNDPDMLEVGNGGMTNTEYKAHFSMWAIMAAPLIAGNDLRNMSQETIEILTNKEVIAVDQDPLGIQGTRVRQSNEQEVWSKLLADSSRAVVLFNRGVLPAGITVYWDDLGMNGETAEVRDLWEHASKGIYKDSFTAGVPGHGAVMLKITAVDANNAGMPLDSEKPGKPAGLKADVVMPGARVNVAWSPVKDNVGVSAYQLLVNDRMIAFSPDTACMLPNPGWNSRHIITVRAQDASGNVSEVSEAVEVKIGPAPSFIYLSDLGWHSATSGWGPVQKDQSVGRKTLSLDGKKYKKGIGTHANSEIVFLLGGAFNLFRCEIGVDDAKTENSKVEFKVYADGVQKYESKAMHPDDPTQKLNIDIAGVDTLKLVVTDGGNTINSDHADWADAAVSK